MTVYGFPKRLPVNESHPRKPINVYGAAKVLAEDIVFAAAQTSHLDYWVLRLPGLFSESRRNGALFHFMCAAAEGRPLVVSATQAIPWDILHVEDAVEAITRALVADDRSPGAINIGYGSPVELVAIAEQIAGLAGTGAPADNIGGVQHPTFQMDIGKARSLLDWPPTTLQARIESVWNALLCEVQSA
jgi:UDP-glucose 4-epimerase